MEKRKKIQLHLFNSELLFCVFKMVESRGGFWQPVTGSVEKGESFVEAAMRELEEETGIIVPNTSLINLDYQFTFESRGIIFEEKAFACPVKKGSKIILSHEHEDYKWLPLDEALNLIHWETNRKALKALCQILSKKNNIKPGLRP